MLAGAMILVMLSVLVGLVLVLVAWGFWRSRSQSPGGTLETRGDVLLWLLLLAIFALGVFVSYALLGSRP
jgi:membrane protease YdiL (CAAX protease family)